MNRTDDPSRRVALVTGASRGIGRAIAEALAAAGHDIAGVSRPRAAAADPSALDALGGEVARRGARFLPIEADVADLACHESIVARVIAAFGRLDLFVSNAGVAPDPRRDLLDMTPESFDRVVGVNLRGAVFLAQAVARRMLAASAGAETSPRAIVFIGSVSADHSSPNRAEYCISKAGLAMAARVFAHRLASSNIRVFEVRPGIVRTGMTAAVADSYDRLIAGGLVPQGRWGEPRDVARAVVALTRGDFDYSTGLVIDVSGGLAIPRL